MALREADHGLGRQKKAGRTCKALIRAEMALTRLYNALISLYMKNVITETINSCVKAFKLKCM